MKPPDAPAPVPAPVPAPADAPAPAPAGGSRLLLTVPEAAAGQRLDRVLADLLVVRLPDAALSRSQVKTLIEAGRVCFGVMDPGATEPGADEDAPDGGGEAEFHDGATVREPAAKVKAGQAFAVFLPDPAPATPAAQPLALDILFEDADLIILDKPAGLVVHPAPGNLDATLVNALLAHCGPELTGIGGVQRPGIVHRIDKDTSGLMVVAKSARAHAHLTRLFAAHDIERQYLALVWGVPFPAQGQFDGAIGRDPADRKRMAIVASGKAAVTHYRVLERFGDAAALVECQLETGRTHQIRVHLTAAGHALIGDPVYGKAGGRRRGNANPLLGAAIAGLGRQALHAASLGFRHPADGRILHFTRPPPADFQEVAEKLRNATRVQTVMAVRTHRP